MQVSSSLRARLQNTRKRWLVSVSGEHTSWLTSGMNFTASEKSALLFSTWLFSFSQVPSLFLHHHYHVGLAEKTCVRKSISVYTAQKSLYNFITQISMTETDCWAIVFKGPGNYILILYRQRMRCIWAAFYLLKRNPSWPTVSLVEGLSPHT